MRTVIFFILCICLIRTNANANLPVKFYDGRPINIAVVSGKVTQVIFPEKVSKIIKGGGADTVLIEVLEESVFILPKTNNPADIFVTDVHGESYPLNLIAGAEHQAKVKIDYAFSSERSRTQERNDVMDLMKLLMQGKAPAGATVLESKEGFTINQGQIGVTLNTIFELPKLNGLVLTAKNLTQNIVILSAQSIAYPSLMAISSELDSLAPQGQEASESRIYMVVEKRNGT